MADSDKNIVITPNTGSSSLNPTIVLTGEGNDPISLKVLEGAAGSISFEGSAGQLLTITNNSTSGSVLTVNDVSGLPSVVVNADGLVQLAPTYGKVAIGQSTVATGNILDIKGNVRIDGDILITQASLVSNLNVELLNGQDSAYYLDWANTTNKPDPTLTLSGDATGSATFTDLGNVTLSVTVTDDSHNHVISNVDGLQTALDAKAPLASPALIGTPTAPTATSGTNTTQIATTAFVNTSVASLVDSAPSTLDTLNELAAALGDDPNFATTVTNSIATKLPLAGGQMTGNITFSGTQTVDGRDLSVDGSKLDGIEAGATADQTASEILTAIKTVDGSGSGLDADTLDGQQGSYYQPASTALTTTTSFGGDVSGTYNAIVIADDSHTHDTRYFTETEADARFLGINAKAADSTLLDGVAASDYALKTDLTSSSSSLESIILYLSPLDTDLAVKTKAAIIPYLPYNLEAQELILKCDTAPTGSNIEVNFLIKPENSIVQIGTDIDGEAAGDLSGWSVSLSADGSIVAIGAIYNNYGGHVRIYQNVNGTWTKVGSDIDGEGFGDQSGYSVSLSADGSVVAIGAIYNNYGGHVRIYQNVNGTWTKVGSDIDGEALDDQSGYSVSLSADGSVVAIGAIRNGGNGSLSGHVRIYQNVNGNWTKVGSDIDGEASNNYSGYSVSLSADGSVVAIGAPYNDGNGSSSGHVRIYQNVNGTWTKVGSDIDGEAAGDQSGESVSLSADGSIVAIGADSNDGNGNASGHVRVYENVNGSWTQVGSDIDGEAAEDYSGRSVSLSADGSVVAIGAPNNDGNGSNSGHVRIYQNVNGSWTQVGADIDGEASVDLSGHSVSLSADGSVVAIGAYQNDGNGGNSGHVRVYQIIYPSSYSMNISSNTTMSTLNINNQINKGKELTVDITQVGATVPGQNLVLIINGERY